MSERPTPDASLSLAFLTERRVWMQAQERAAEEARWSIRPTMPATVPTPCACRACTGPSYQPTSRPPRNLWAPRWNCAEQGDALDAIRPQPIRRPLTTDEIVTRWGIIARRIALGRALELEHPGDPQVRRPRRLGAPRWVLGDDQPAVPVMTTTGVCEGVYEWGTRGRTVRRREVFRSSPVRYRAPAALLIPGERPHTPDRTDLHGPWPAADLILTRVEEPSQRAECPRCRTELVRLSGDRWGWRCPCRNLDDLGVPMLSRPAPVVSWRIRGGLVPGRRIVVPVSMDDPNARTTPSETRDARPCADCGEPFTQPRRRGRPATVCPTCRAADPHRNRRRR